MKKKTTEEWIEEAKKVHGNKYDYSKVEYINSHTKVCIICPKHGEFFIEPNQHIGKKKEKQQGCSKCGKLFLSKLFSSSKEEFIEKAKKIHGYKYNYSKVNYINSITKVCIICPKHGEFWQTPGSHLQGYNCPLCKGEKYKKLFSFSREKFIEKAKQVHGDKYDYSKVNYVNNKTKICIICPKHGEFWQTPYNHINKKSNCPICFETTMEEEIRLKLQEENINFIQYSKFDWLQNAEKSYPLELDFYLPDYNIAIEYQGRQHFEEVNFAGKGEEWTKNEFEKNIKKDELKYNLVSNNGINILYIFNQKYLIKSQKYKIYNKKNIFENIEEVIKKIRE